MEAVVAWAAAARPARAPKTNSSVRELEPNRLAPLIETHGFAAA
jgi:hypothetical protein